MDNPSSLPNALFWSLLGAGECAETVLQALTPFTFPRSAVRPRERANSMLPVLRILALVALSVSPLTAPLSVHSVPLPHSLEEMPIGPSPHTKSVNVVLHELALELGAIRPKKAPITMALATLELALVPRAIAPSLYARAMLPLLYPGAFIRSATALSVRPLTMKAVVGPLASISVSVFSRKNSMTMTNSPVELAFVVAAIGQDQHSLSIWNLSTPLAGVLGLPVQLPRWEKLA